MQMYGLRVRQNVRAREQFTAHLISQSSTFPDDVFRAGKQMISQVVKCDFLSNNLQTPYKSLTV